MKVGVRSAALPGLKAIDPPMAVAGLLGSERPPVGQWRPKVSILVLNLDGADLLDRMFRSFAAINSYGNYEFVVVDHGSSDGTQSLLEAWSGQLPIQVINRDGNYSFSNSNNMAARFATGELLLFLNNDILLSSDFIGPMVEVLADQVIGAVGIKQYAIDSGQTERRINHLGVRFEWSVPERRLRPRHVKPGLNDALLSSNPSVFPAVTGSCLMCRADEFAEVGGLDEGYFYGLEDLDLCCKLRLILGKAIVSLNDHHILHDKSTTRNRDVPVKDSVQANNRRLLQARWGYQLRREFIASKTDDDGSTTGARFTLGIAGSEAADDVADGLREALRRLCDWRVRRITPADAADASGLDALVVIDGALDPATLQNRQPHLVLISWALQAKAPSCALGEEDRFHIYLGSSTTHMEALTEHTSKPKVMFRAAVDTGLFTLGVERPDLACDCLVLGDLGDGPQALEAAGADDAPLTFRALAPSDADCAGSVDRASRAAAFSSAPLVIDTGEDGASLSAHVMEALACGGLVLTKNRVVAQEVFSGLLPVWGDAAELETAVRRYRNDPEARRALVQWLRDRVLREHTFEHRARALRDVIAEELGCIRVGLKLGPVGAVEAGPAMEFCRTLARDLGELGYRTRIDTAEDWYSAQSLADDVAVILPQAEGYEPSPDQINIRLAADALESAAATVRDAIQVEHVARTSPPAVERLGAADAAAERQTAAV